MSSPSFNPDHLSESFDKKVTVNTLKEASSRSRVKKTTNAITSMMCNYGKLAESIDKQNEGSEEYAEDIITATPAVDEVIDVIDDNNNSEDDGDRDDECDQLSLSPSNELSSSVGGLTNNVEAEKSLDENKEEIIKRYYSYGTELLEEFAYSKAAAASAPEQSGGEEGSAGSCSAGTKAGTFNKEPPTVLEQIQFLEENANKLRDENRRRIAEYLAKIRKN